MGTEKKTITVNIPRAESDLISIAKNVAEVWKTKPAFTLVWTTQEKFAGVINSFENSFEKRSDIKGNRSIVSGELKTLNNEINTSLQYVKNYLADTYSKKDAPTHYTRFGIVKQGGVYNLPRDNDDRLYALRNLAKAIDTAEFADQKYGKAYWADLLQRFEQAKTVAERSDAESSQHVGLKNEQKPVIRQTLNSLVLLIKANYPGTWRDELRVWGFHKEKY